MRELFSPSLYFLQASACMGVTHSLALVYFLYKSFNYVINSFLLSFTQVSAYTTYYHRNFDMFYRMQVSIDKLL